MYAVLFGGTNLTKKMVYKHHLVYLNIVQLLDHGADLFITDIKVSLNKLLIFLSGSQETIMLDTDDLGVVS